MVCGRDSQQVCWAKALRLFICLVLVFPATLTAAYTTLKGSNGRIVDFQIEAVGMDGIRAVPRGGHKALLLRWDQLDLNWLRREQPTIWDQKQQIEAMGMVAYGDFRFGDSRARIYELVNSKNGYSLPSESFGEQAPGALWVTFDPENLREFYRFHFDGEDRLDGLERHIGFSRDESIETGLKAEWTRLIEILSTYHAESVQAGPLPSSREWQAALKKTDLAKGRSWNTHTWQDARRDFELTVAVRKLDVGVRTATEGKITFFGKEMILTDSSETNTNWIVLKARLR